MPDETGYSLLRADIAAGFKHDERIRALELEQAETKVILASLPKMEDRLMEAIKANAPKPVWPAVGALAAVAAVFLVLAAAIYTR